MVFLSRCDLLIVYAPEYSFRFAELILLHMIKLRIKNAKKNRNIRSKTVKIIMLDIFCLVILICCLLFLFLFDIPNTPTIKMLRYTTHLHQK